MNRMSDHLDELQGRVTYRELALGECQNDHQDCAIHDCGHCACRVSYLVDEGLMFCGPCATMHEQHDASFDPFEPWPIGI